MQPGAARKFSAHRSNAFGHPGAGGSHAFADPENKISFAYVMNQMEQSVLPNEKSLRLVDAMYAEGRASARPKLKRGQRKHVPPLFAHHRHNNLPPMRGAPMFEKKNSLPGSKLHSSIHNRNGLAAMR